MTYITRLISCSIACLSAKPSDDIVFPPPVGTVSVYSPFGPEATSRQLCNILVLNLLISDFGFSNRLIYSVYFLYNFFTLSPVGRITLPSDIKHSVSKKSASTRHEYNILIKKAIENPFFSIGSIGRTILLGIGISSSFLYWL